MTEENKEETPLTFVNVDETKTEFQPEPKAVLTEEEAAALEAPLDIENPDATPNRYNLFAADQTKKANDIVNGIMNDIIMKLDMPYAFVELIPNILAGKIKIVKGKSKEYEVVNRADNKFHLTPIKDLQLYESIEDSKKESEDLGD